jgi:hypothetical protein
MFDATDGITVSMFPASETCVRPMRFMLYETGEGYELHSAFWHAIDDAVAKVTRVFSCRDEHSVLAYIKQWAYMHEDNEIHLHQANGKRTRTYSYESFEAAS